MGMPFPIKAEQLALEYTAQVNPKDPIRKVSEHDIDGFEGILIARPEKQGWYILHDRRIPLLGRRNFTIGHELGHYMLHRHIVQKFECNQKALLDYGSAESKVREHEANTFASYLLMPIDDYRNETNGHEMSFDVLEHCADRYCVSLTAAVLKWLEFTTETAVFVVSRDGFMLWSRASTSARQRGYVWRPGTPLPPGSLAAEASRYRPQDRAGVAMPKGAWHPSDETREMLIVSDQYESSFSLVLFNDIGGAEIDEPQAVDAFDRVMQPFERDRHV